MNQLMYLKEIVEETKLLIIGLRKRQAYKEFAASD